MWSLLSSSKSKPCVSPELEKVITKKQRALLTSLCSNELGQSHLFQNWTSSTADDVSKREFVEQLENINDSYPTGIAGYVQNARVLLQKSKEGINSFDGWKATVPVGHSIELGTDEYKKVEKLGQPDLGFVGFVLLAGGLGERLGYSDIKLRLPIELASETCYLAFYIEYILAVQENYAPKGKKLPLCIMTSAETNAGTIKLLEENSYFGMPKEQITIVQQGAGVPALLNNDAKIALKSKYEIMTKPHGHGDVHALLYTHQIAKKWVEQGIKWISFFQDTNALGFHSLSLALGVSKKFGLLMNSLAIPRKAKQAIGSIVKLTNTKTQEER
jgi:UDP-sugar pyrophosphorylase